MKTAEEILQKIADIKIIKLGFPVSMAYYTNLMYSSDDVLQAMHEFNNQFEGDCVHPYESLLGDGETQPAKCLKCGKILS